MMMIDRIVRLACMLVLVLLCAGPARAARAEDLRLWYRQPAANWNEGLMLGNGRLGGVVWGGGAGGVEEERIDLNEDTLWSGEPYNNLNPEGLRALPEVRRLLVEGKLIEAQKLVEEKMNGNNNESYMPLGTLFIRPVSDPPLSRPLPAPAASGSASRPAATAHLAPPPPPPNDYVRELALDDAVSRVSYTLDGVKYTREIFASFPAQALVVRISADQPGKVSFRAMLGSQLRNSVKAEGGVLRMSGRCPVHVDPAYIKEKRIVYDDGPNPKGMRFDTRLAAIHEGGSVRAGDDGLVAEGCDAVTLILCAQTSYNGPDKSPSREGKDEAALCAADLSAAAAKPFAALRAAHVADVKALMGRVSLDLGHDAEAEKLPTDVRIKRYQPGQQGGGGDRALAALYYQFGRYLLVSCSRPGPTWAQPSNLQGLWNASLRPPWSANFTLNCNVEIDYWPVEAANLAECHEPLIELVRQLSVDGANIAKNLYGVRGWMAHHNTDIWRQAGPVGGGPGSARWTIFQVGGTWLCQHLWEHYAFSGDKEYLRRIWPVLKGAARFHLDNLMEEPEHRWLVTGPDVNFENNWKKPDGTSSAVCMGPTASMEMIRELFNNCRRATEILGTDAELRAEIDKALPRLPPLQVSPTTGELQEWMDDWARTSKGQALSSWGAICSDQITPRGTPKFAAALRKIFDDENWWQKGLIGSWEGAFQSNVYARLHDGDTALAVVEKHLQTSVNPNLSASFPGHTKYQIDGNLGQTAAIQEMLLQSQVHDAAGVYEIELLPALPKAWREGSVRGLRARGGFVVDVAWKEGKLVSAVLASPRGGRCRLRYGEGVLDLEVPAGGAREMKAASFEAAR